MSQLKTSLAVQWWYNGDFPNENPEFEGDVVRYFRHPNYSGESRCPKCHKTYHEHGFIDRREADVICPGDVIYSFEKNHPVDSLGVISANNFSKIFGPMGLCEAQQNCGSFKRGDTHRDILGRVLLARTIPYMLDLYRRAGVYLNVHLEFPALEYKNSDLLQFAVDSMNGYTEYFWKRVHASGAWFDPSVVNVWGTSIYSDINSQMQNFGLKLHEEKEYHALGY